MGTFADTMYTLLLGWLRSAAYSVWQLCTGADAAAWFRWVLDNWLSLVLLLCGAGLFIDLVVHLLRWQPYRVWASFLRSLTGRKEKLEAVQPDTGGYRRWVYADGTTRVEEVDAPGEAPAEPAQLDAPVRPVRRAIPASADSAYHRPVYPPDWQRGDES